LASRRRHPHQDDGGFKAKHALSELRQSQGMSSRDQGGLHAGTSRATFNNVEACVRSLGGTMMLWFAGRIQTDVLEGHF
jgi:hypothetical protein